MQKSVLADCGVCCEMSENKWERKYQDWYCGNSPQSAGTLDFQYKLFTSQIRPASSLKLSNWPRCITQYFRALDILSDRSPVGCLSVLLVLLTSLNLLYSHISSALLALFVCSSRDLHWLQLTGDKYYSLPLYWPHTRCRSGWADWPGSGSPPWSALITRNIKSSHAWL